jgi:hypothetical protein
MQRKRKAQLITFLRKMNVLKVATRANELLFYSNIIITASKKAAKKEKKSSKIAKIFEDIMHINEKKILVVNDIINFFLFSYVIVIIFICFFLV